MILKLLKKHNLTPQDQYFGKLFLIVGPSGAGKGTVIKALKNTYRGFVYPVSYTTRERREGEVDGEVYHFITKPEFEKMIANDEFLEYAQVHSDNYYGTSKKHILEPLKAGAIVIREVDVQGFHSIRDILPKGVLISIFVKVANEDELKKRIFTRGELPDDEVKRRMESARMELEQADLCDYQVENAWGEIESCISRVEQIILNDIKPLYQ